MRDSRIWEEKYTDGGQDLRLVLAGGGRTRQWRRATEMSTQPEHQPKTNLHASEATMSSIHRLALTVVLAASLIFAVAPAQAVDTCGGQTSIGNPMPCCSNGGNCTWWTWKMAKDAGWFAIPTGNANTWDDTARLSPAYRVSSTPSLGAIGVRESAPYNCGGTSICDYGHVAWITGITSTGVSTTQMACGGSFGVTSVPRATGYFNSYISKVNLNGQAASICTDGRIVATSSSVFGDTLQVWYSSLCKTTWARIVAKNSVAAVTVSIRRTTDSLTKSASGFWGATSPMVETGAIVACANGKAGTTTLPQVCK